MAQPQTSHHDGIKILSVVWFKVLPPKFGGQKAVALFNRHLAELAPLTCLCSANNEAGEENYAVENRLPVSKAQVLNPFVWRMIYQTAKRQGATHLLLEFPYHGIAGMLCKKFLRCKLVVNTHNIEYRRFKEQKKWWWGLLYHLEKRTLRSADAVFFKTRADLEAALKTFGLKEEKLSVIPYGIEPRKHFNKKEAKRILWQRHGVKPEEKILLFAATLDYAPNAEAVLALAERVIPALQQYSSAFKMVVCGRNHFEAFAYLNKMENTQLVMAGEVEDISLYFEAADVFVNPVFTGGGVQTKIVDALSYDLNVVCFQSRLAGIENADDKIFSVPANDWQAFVSAIVKAAQPQTPTPTAFFETYDWRSIAAKAYQKIISC